MNFLIVIPLLAFLSKGNAECYDRYTPSPTGSYSVGEKYTRSKFSGELIGTYNCTCLARGRIVCRAFEIPCFDVTTGKYVPKGKRFNTLSNGRLKYNCMCQGGQAEYDSCEPGHLQGDGSCSDYKGEVVRNGQRYVIRRFGALVRCLCKNGKAATGSCKRKICRDEVLGSYAEQGQIYSKVKNGQRFNCTCGKNGEEEEDSCTNAEEEQDEEQPHKTDD